MLISTGAVSCERCCSSAHWSMEQDDQRPCPRPLLRLPLTLESNLRFFYFFKAWNTLYLPELPALLAGASDQLLLQCQMFGQEPPSSGEVLFRSTSRVIEEPTSTYVEASRITTAAHKQPVWYWSFFNRTFIPSTCLTPEPLPPCFTATSRSSLLLQRLKHSVTVNILSEEHDVSRQLNADRSGSADCHMTFSPDCRRYLSPSLSPAHSCSLFAAAVWCVLLCALELNPTTSPASCGFSLFDACGGSDLMLLILQIIVIINAQMISDLSTKRMWMFKFKIRAKPAALKHARVFMSYWSARCDSACTLMHVNV